MFEIEIFIIEMTLFILRCQAFVDEKLFEECSVLEIAIEFGAKM